MDRVKNFEQLRFGMFIHFGLFSQIEAGEWVWYTDETVRSHYDDLLLSFCPQCLDWDEIILTARKAGCRYVTLTTRHHDGFSLYDTKGLSTYDVMHTPYGKDIVKEFVDACHKHDVVPFLYHTTLDWQHPSFQNHFPAYLEYLRESIRVLCTEYGEIGGFWFDGNWSRKNVDWQEDELYAMIRSYQPDAILINNTGLSEPGKRGNPQLDTLTFEQGKLTSSPERDYGRHLAMEACQTMNHHWGCADLDLDYKSPRELIEMLNACRSQESNYLLNVGLKADGSIGLMEKALLEQVGKWLTTASETFYTGRLSTVKSDAVWYGLDDENHTDIYVKDVPLADVDHVIAQDVPFQEWITLCGVKRQISDVFWLDHGEALEFQQHGDQVNVHLTPYPYGRHTIVRIFRIIYQS